ncbi:hypothetical protein ABKP09_19720 [Peribacillus frigoritolerans]|uniref:hypothetical protein n=1 Tax=Peribacillus frigoritolerans TaxID=450367 RepID=UPI0032B5AFE9
METLKRLYELENDLKEKRELLNGNSHNLNMFGRKDMPLAIYDYVIAKLREIAHETK